MWTIEYSYRCYNCGDDLKSTESTLFISINVDSDEYIPLSLFDILKGWLLSIDITRANCLKCQKNKQLFICTKRIVRFPCNPLVRLHRETHNMLNIYSINNFLEVTFAIFYKKLTKDSGHWYCA